jgi:GNAT superfamily N-acetyltransferase
MAMHRGPMLHAASDTARITVLVVDPDARRQGIAAALMARARAWSAECGVLEVTTGLQREDAHAFYRGEGFVPSALRFKHGPGR